MIKRFIDKLLGTGPKPKFGKRQEVGPEEHGIDLGRSFMVGDRWGDVAAGAAAGCETILLNMPYSQCHRCSPDHRVADLPEAADLILEQLRVWGYRQ